MRTVAIVGDGDTLLRVTEEKEVVFLIDGRRQAMSVADAKGLLSYLVERTLPAQSLHYKISRAVQEDGGEVQVNAKEREELLRVLDAIEMHHALNDPERDLREALL